MAGAERRTRMTPEERRKQLIALGVNALADRPLEEITIEFLASEAGVSRGLVFYYFNSKTGLHHELIQTARDSLMRATEPKPELPASQRLHDTLERFVGFARDHRQTFYSLVRGTASGDEDVRTIVEEVRSAQAERLSIMFHELGAEQTPRLQVALRAWVALAEQALVDGAVNHELTHDELVAFLERSCLAVVELAAHARG
ncbi:TetR/AcrR family transcriptional regulator [Gryllotalpicola protaetiae]|uniref:TetR/AcrR family transcriptional regulator n=1 Tax=Gryllotalpicola protaetiae TaxID=2419771 RepID=A0A387BW92_9MICO|nr:TetR/AcrR family transcriptional regulator [Gryllotalpicola protaetiae]AYG02651.1 TetR/AcrR family transcriptional regulator [Gryllotalpicola protaetiae]